ncbi:MAG: nitrogenase iron protein NifH, partial [Lachnospiraceae bacterium]|nr:nitrogenase iron protein NifH [Lachnospiraceae bacterium]
MKIEIAVYGKGGIGKSTISANLSAAMAVQGRKVLQIGCDPKHDSTRLLMHGETIQTVMEYLKETDPEFADPFDVLREGFKGIGCVENGGPKPGVGCAGRGIISSFEFLNKFKVKDRYDTVVYDVLGDVVCGGFAVPIRREYADVIVLVTSGEYMALYAANNILRGIHSYDGDTECRVAGIVYNERRLPDEDGRVQRFADAVGLPILKKVPRSDAFARAEMEHVTLQELEQCEYEKGVFRELADQIRPGMKLYPAKPLEDMELERVVLQTGNAEKMVNNEELLDAVGNKDVEALSA